MRVLRPMPMTLLVMLFPGLVSVGGWYAQFDFCSAHRRGANLNLGLTIVALTALVFVCLVGIMLFVSRDIWRWRRWIAGACVVEAAVVAGAIALVAIDSATVVSTRCDFITHSPDEVHHLSGLYYAFGFAAAALLYQGARLLLLPPPEPPASRYEHPDWFQEPPVGGR